MKTVGKILLGVGITGVVGFVLYKTTQKAADIEAFKNMLSFRIDPKGISATKTAINVRVDVVITNPTKTSVSFQKPFLQLKYGKQVFASSKMSSDTVTVAAQNVTTIKNYTLQIPLSVTTALQLVGMIKKVATDFPAISTVSEFVAALSQSVLDKLLPLMTVSGVVYIGNTPITFEKQLG